MSRLVVGAVVATGAWVGGVLLLRTDTPPHGVVIGLLYVVLSALTWWVVRDPAAGATTPTQTTTSRVRRPVLALALVAALAQAPGLFQPPLTSNDSYRYVWDGRVQLAGVSPYRYAPLDDRLARLRDPVLFPGLSPDQRSGYTTQPVPTDRTLLLALAKDDPRVAINRPKVPTIYPPVAQLWFTAVAAVTPWSLGTLGLQIGSALLAVAVAAMLAAMLRRRGRNPLLALWWAWSPTVLLEAGNGAHVDIVAAVLIVFALAVGTVMVGDGGFAGVDLPRGKRWAAGVLVGLATSVKLFPLLTVVAFTPLSWRRWTRALPAPVAAVATLVLSYLPHVLVAGTLVVGYLRGYVTEEGGGDLSVLRLLLPDVLADPVAAVILLAVAFWGVRRVATGIDPVVPACALLGTFLLLATSAYPWYAVSLVALAVLARRLEWVVVALAAELTAPSSHMSLPSALVWLAAAVVVLAVVGVRNRRRLPVASFG